MKVIALLLAGLAVATGAPTPRGPLTAKVRLALSAAEGVAYEKAPVSFHVDVHNETDEPMVVGLVLHPVFHKYVRVLYRRLPNDLQALAYTSEWDMPGHPEFTYLRLSAGGQESVSLSVAADPARNAFVFDRPGDYELKVVCDINWYTPRDVLETHPLRIRVEPAPPSEAAALQDWDVELAIFAQNDGGEGGPRFREVLPRALKFMDDHPTSLYAQALRKRSFDTLKMLERRGMKLTDYEREAFERLKQPPLPQ